MTAATLHLLCAGAARGLVLALEPRYSQDTGARIAGRFGAVGAMKEALLAGESCDLMIVTEAMVDELTAQGVLLASGRAALGRVKTGIAVKRGAPRPEVGTPEALAAALRSAEAIYFPDPLRATAGIHFAGVMRELGVHDELHARLRTFPNGATAMRELAAQPSTRVIGCTQVSEILYTQGVELVAALPPRFELATVYTAAVSATAREPALAQRLIELLAGESSRVLRRSGGFED